MEYLKKMERILAGKQAILDNMIASGDSQTCTFECRVIGYRNAVNDLRFEIWNNVEEMARGYGEE